MCDTVEMGIRYTHGAKPPDKSAPVDQGLDRPPVTREATGSNPVGRATKPVGRPASGKERIAIRLDTAVLAKFRATGKGWQARINDVLKEAKL